MPDSRITDSTDKDGAPLDELRTCVQLLLERFPHLQSVATRLLENNETFRDLCEEYEACAQAIERLAPPEADVAMFREFSALRLRLEGELLRYISDNWSEDARQ